MSHSVRLVLQRNVRQIVNRVQCARRVPIEPSELRIKVGLRLTLSGDEFETFAQRSIRRQTGDQDLGELATRDDPVAGVAGMPAIALEQYESMFVWLVVVEPARSHDRVRQTAGAYEPLTAALPIVGLRLAVVVALTVGDADGGHQRDAHRPPVQRGEHASDSPVVDPLRSGLAAAVRAVCEDDCIHAIDRGSQRVRTCEVTDDHLRIGKQFACFSGIAREGTYGVALPDGLLHDETPDAAGGTDNEHGHTLVTHPGTTSSIAVLSRRSSVRF